jgi:hypothetical protein
MNIPVVCSFPVEQIIRQNKTRGIVGKQKWDRRGPWLPVHNKKSVFATKWPYSRWYCITVILCSNCMLWLSSWPHLTSTTLHKPTYQWNNNVILLSFSVIELRSLKIMNCVVSEPSESETALLFTNTKTGGWNTENICQPGFTAKLVLN